MPKEEKILVEGVVSEALPGAEFKVQLESGVEILAKIAGKLRQNRIRVLLHDPVQVELSPYDVTRGIIVYRGKKKPVEDSEASTDQ